MDYSSRTPEGESKGCPICRNGLVIEPLLPTREATCPNCGTLLWFPPTTGSDPIWGFLKFEVVEPEIRTAQQAIPYLVDRFVASGNLEQQRRDEVVAALIKREELGSTGIGRGLAVPHTRVKGLETLIGAVADFSHGLEFESLDGKPVRRICMLLSPVDQPVNHLAALEAICRHWRLTS